jgi:hypothetical protein
MTQKDEYRVEYENNGTKWRFSVIFDKWSITCNGYESKSAAKAAFDELKLNWEKKEKIK